MNISLPLGISLKKEQLSGCQAYVFRHNKLGEIGRIVFQGLPNGHCHLSSEVAGDQDDPMTETRKAMFLPLSEQLTGAMEDILGKGKLGSSMTPVSPKTREIVESKLIPCERCGENVAMLIFSDVSDQGCFEDYARKMYHQYSNLDILAWIIGPPIGELNGPRTPTNIMKVWPNREPIKTVIADEFNADLDVFLDKHCREI